MSRDRHLPPDPTAAPLPDVPAPAAARGDGAFFWRTLDELAADPAFAEQLHNEFPSAVEAVTDPVERRAFLKLMGASLGLAGLTACTRQPLETIVPYVRQPEDIVPGQPLFFATAMTLGGVATGMLVESHEGRPTKIEGNPQHPDSLGASDVFGQAAILDLYDPHRAQAVTNLGEIRPWPVFLATIRAALVGQEPVGGAGLRILTEAVGSPTLAAQIEGVLAKYPDAKWHQWDPASRQSAHAGALRAFGAVVDTQYLLADADVILTLDADVLTQGPGSLRHARAFAARRRPDDLSHMNRLYALETMPTATGSRADHRLALRPSEIETAARQIAVAVGVTGARVANAAPVGGSEDGRAGRWVAAVAKDLLAHKGRSLVVAGDSQPPVVHALAHAMNEALGNVGRTVVYTDPVTAAPVDQMASIADLTRAMAAGQVDILVVVGANPAYSAPGGLNFAGAMARVPLSIHMSRHQDETSALSHWHVPESHFLESWSDARASDGTVSIVQPLIAPLYATRSPHELFAAMGDTPEKAAYDLVREYWIARVEPTSGGGATQGGEAPEPSPAFEAAWRRWLHDGVVPGTAFAPRAVTLVDDALAAGPAAGDASVGLEVQFRNDPCVLDGRFAANGWLQELPKPITKLTWDNAVLVSPATAVALGVRTSLSMQGGERGQTLSELVRLEHDGRTVVGAVFPVVGHPDGCATLHLGYGRRRGGPVATGAGFDANALRSPDAPWAAAGVVVAKTGAPYSLACTQAHHMMEGRGLVRAATREAFERDPHVVHEGQHVPPRTLTLVPEHAYDGYKWGMAIDVNACLGCNACVVGCQAENNIAVVGKAQVLRGREMHWLRVDTYYRGPAAHPETYHQPVPCMQCENAPCEVVCPVNATVHSQEGLNDMVYNRCVGTRYCSNNCPYKVRRFNYHLYQDWETPSLKLLRNPDVTVRSRGVMEKCTYCVQRINAARIAAKRDDRQIRDGDIRTACEAVCPADAIVFGNLNDPESRVSRLQAEVRHYTLLAELNARPRTGYLAAVRNVNPELEA
jgi:molybdopterin-containing oxidoreductase family iron-sulfur binding subunit